MKTIKEFLEKEKEEMPKWLENYEKGQKLDFDEILNHKIVFYPGSGEDGQAIKTFNNAHFAHTFLYVDYMLKKEYIKNRLHEEFLGYHLLDFREIAYKDLLSKKYVKRANYKEQFFGGEELKERYYFFCVYERDEEYDDNHGAKRFALIYLFADAFEVYSNVFVNSCRTPTLIWFRDKEMCHYAAFGKTGPMERMAYEFEVFPKYLMCEYDEPWHGYINMAGISGMYVGGYDAKNLREVFLFVKDFNEEDVKNAKLKFFRKSIF